MNTDPNEKEERDELGAHDEHEEHEEPEEKLQLSVEITELGDYKKEISIQVAQEDVTQQLKNAYTEIRKSIQVPGFRPGKIPNSILRARFGKTVNQEVAKNLINTSLKQISHDYNFQSVGDPIIEPSEFAPDQAYSFKLTIDFVPEVVLGNYMELTADRPIMTISDKDIEQEILKLQEKQAIRTIVTDRPIQPGDHVLIELSMVNVADGQPIMETTQVELDGIPTGHHFPNTNFEAQLIGLELNQTKEFEISFPEDYVIGLTAGKTVKFTCKVLELKKKELPELNDAFAQDIADLETLDKLKEAIRQQLVEQRKYGVENYLKELVITQAINNAQFEPSKKLIDRQLAILIDSDDSDEIEKARPQLENRAKALVKRQLVLQKIATEEAIDVTEKDIDNEISRLAAQKNVTPNEMRRRLEDADALDGLTLKIIEAKVETFIFTNAVIKDSPDAEAAFRANAALLGNNLTQTEAPEADQSESEEPEAHEAPGEPADDK